jgi:hypothetical protein
VVLTLALFGGLRQSAALLDQQAADRVASSRHH